MQNVEGKPIDQDFKFDAVQESALAVLALFTSKIEAQKALIANIQSIFKKKLHFIGEKRELYGVYLWGEVGRGKSLILRHYFDSLKTQRKLFIHFHQFMLLAHREFDILRNQKDNANIIKKYAKNLAEKFNAIFLDELQINNIADAMIVGRLFKALQKEGVYIFFTSNRVPSDLFKDGLQRENFLPFIKFIEDELYVFHLDNFVDYRLLKILYNRSLYYYPINQDNEEKLDKLVKDLTGKEHLHEVVIEVDGGRKLTILKSYGNFAEFTFDELCNANLGAADYLAIAKSFAKIVIKNIPVLDIDMHNQALRFITLIDCLYLHQIKVIFLAEDMPENLYKIGKNNFEFTRTISRIKEMISEEYWVSDQASTHFVD